ncbi:MAG TPA: hypothetical protein VJB66_01980 [Candidatus Nanoarchaeia archaeon]|nr:hypothetical protein [Candidatus Nanoarchaeia archaeon]
MGLAIVVLLISLIFLFVLQFTITRAEEKPQQMFSRRQLAYNTVSTLVSTTTTYDDLTVKDLIQDCMDVVPEYDFDNDGDADSCETAEGIISNILTNTLKAWDKKYEFQVKLGPQEEMKISNGQCDLGSDPGINFIPTRGGSAQITVTLELCE